jgi:hypothetical protein
MGLVSGVKGFFSGLEKTLSLEHLKTVLGDLAKVAQNIITVFTKAKDIFKNVLHLFDSVKGEINGWKNFKQDIRFRSRVINLESAIQKTRDLIEGIPQSWHAVLDVISEIKSALAKDVAGEEVAALLAVETAGLSEVVEVLTILYQVLSFVEGIISDFQTIVDEVMRVRLEVEKLDTIFLSQSNKRKYLKLANGKSVRIRVGHLHS